MRFTFDRATAAPGSAAAGATSGGVSPWVRLSGRKVPSSLIIAGTFVATLGLEYSNNPDFDKGSDFATDAASYNAPTLRELPLGIATFVRVRCTAYTSGSPILSFAEAIGTNDAPFVLPEDSKKTPAPSSAGS